MAPLYCLNRHTVQHVLSPNKTCLKSTWNQKLNSGLKLPGLNLTFSLPVSNKHHMWRRSFTVLRLVPCILFSQYIPFHAEMVVNDISCWHGNLIVSSDFNIMPCVLHEYSSRSRTRLTCTCPTCPCPWMSKSWRTFSNLSDRSSPHASYVTLMESAEVWASPG